jgi:two-component system, LytTR family, sensor kinase
MNPMLTRMLPQAAVWVAIYSAMVGLTIAFGTGITSFAAIAGRMLALLLAMMVPVYASFALLDRLPRARQAALAVCAVLLLWTSLANPVFRFLGFTQSWMQDLVNFAVVVGVALAIRGTVQGWGYRREASTAKHRQTLAEQRLAAAQLAPHTLYNMLNKVYATCLSDPQRAPSMVLTLAEMMRHLTQGAQRDLCPASEEWDFIASYRDFILDGGREGISIDMRFVGEEDTPVPMLLLTTLFENAVKYGTHNDGRLRVRLALTATEDRWHFVIENDLPAQTSAVYGLRMGQALMRERLEHLYPLRHTLRIDHRPERYRVEIHAC